MLDLIFQNAKIVDGTGNPFFIGDVGIEGNLISRIGDLDGVEARRKVNVDGRVIAPGFIDIHSHSDFTIPVYPRAESSIRQGITTLVVGNCGISPFPVNPDRLELLRGFSGFAEGALTGEWQDAAGYVKFLESKPLSSNIALQVGHGPVRIAVMGFDNREPTEQELAEMEKLVAEAMEQGVFGFSTGLIYVPGSYSKTEELVALAKVAARYGGFYSSHLRGEGDTLVEAVEEALTIGREAHIGVQLSHHKAAGEANWGLVETTLKMIDNARASGQDVLADQYPFTAGSTTLTALLPQWALEGGIDAMRQRLSDPSIRDKIKAAIANADEDTGARQFSPEKIMIANMPDGQNKKYEGLMLPEIAALREEDPIDSALYLLQSTSKRIQMIIFSMAEEDVRKVMRHPAVAVGTDSTSINEIFGGKPHPRTYSTFPRVLGKYVREEKVLRLEDAVRKMTSLSAQRLGRFDLGLIRKGCKADLVVFDPDKIRDLSTYQDPHRYCEGINQVVVNGKIVIDEGQDSGVAAGKVLRRGVLD